MDIERIFNLDEYLAIPDRDVLRWQGRDYLLKTAQDFSPADLGRYRGIGELLENIPDAENGPDGMAAWRANITGFMQGMFYGECPPIDWSDMPVRGIVGLCDFFADTLNGQPPPLTQRIPATPATDC